MRSMASTVADSGMGSSPSRSPIVGSPHGMSGNAFARFDASRFASNARSMSCITCSESAMSSARCSGAERGHEPAHGRRATGHVLQQLVQALRVVRDQVAVALHEPVEVVLLAARPLLDHLVELGEHVAEARERFRAHVLQAVGHVPEVRAQHLLAQVLHQLVEEPLRLGIHEAVVGELTDLPRRVGRQRIQEHLAHPRVVLGLERQRAPLAVQDLLELLADLLERTA